MSLRFEEETNIYDHVGNLLGQIAFGDDGHYPSLITNSFAEITIDELREIADYLESL